MVKALFSHTDSRLAYTGTWAAPVTDGNFRSGSSRSTGTVGSAVVASVSGATGVIFTGMRGSLACVYDVTVDGSTVGRATGSVGTVGVNIASLYQTTLCAVSLPNASAHTVGLTLVSGTLTIDQLEIYVADAPTANKLLVAGHSIAAGAVGVASGNVTYPGAVGVGPRLAASLGLNEVNIAQSGASLCVVTPNAGVTSTYWELLRDNSYWDEQLPQVAMLMIGYNDIRATNPAAMGAGVSVADGEAFQLARFLARLQDLLRRMRLRVPTCAVIVPAIGWADTEAANEGWRQANAGAGVDLTYGWPDGSQPNKNSAMAWNAGILGLAAGNPNMVYVDTEADTAANGGRAITGDGSHPNETGHYVLARRIAAVYRAWRGSGAAMA